MSTKAIRSMTPFVALLIAAGAAAPAAQRGARNGEWTAYGADAGNTRYSPLDQINGSNFSQLEVGWRFKTDALGPRPEYQFESTPLMVNGTVYSTAGSRRAVVALDAGTGELVWMHSEHEGPRGAAAPRQLSGRGLAYWTDPAGKDRRILYVTPGYRLIALDARTGAVITSFGKNGAVDLKMDMDQRIDPLSPEIGLHATPAIARNVVIIGAAHKSGGVPTGKSNVKGYVRGFDVRSGKRLWIFHTIPSPGEFGNDTWEKDSWSYTGNAGVWAQISIDEELGLAYLPVELPTGDYFGANRPGNNLFGESVVAVDLQTGKRKWHYQLVHHGIWDMDIPCAPILVDAVVNGRTIKAVAQPTKQAFLYVFDRATGQPIWPIEERPVPRGEVPGEWYAPTQPFPLDGRGRLFNYDRQGLVEDDLIDFTPELRAEALKIVSQYKIGPIFTPPVVSKLPGPLATLAMASAGGGTNWGGGSYDPETRVVYVFSQRAARPLGLVPPRDPTKNDLQYVQGNAATGARTTAGAGGGSTGEGGGEGGGGAVTVQGLPIMKPPYGSLNAIDLNKGEVIWQVAHGETPAAITNHAALKGMTIPRTGRPGIVGQLVTKTLLVVGEAGFGPTPSGQRGAMLRAYDKATGKEVGAVYMPAPQSGSPMTYMHDNRQHIIVAVGGPGYSGELLAFRLASAK
jgi:quinoprotein glucose dehydrogenase